MLSDILGGRTGTAVKINSLSCIVAALVIHTIGPQSVILLPGLVQGMVAHGGFTDQQAGFISSAEMWGMTVGAVSTAFLMSRFGWRWLLLVALMVMISCNFLSTLTRSFEVFCALRFLVGVGGGLIVTLCYVIFGMTAKSDRNFALGIFFVLLYGAVTYPLIPFFLSGMGLNGLLYFFTAVGVIGLPFLRFIPISADDHRPDNANDAASIDSFRQIMALGAIFLFFVGNIAIWVYFYRIGVFAGVEEQSIANSLSVSQFFGMAGAFACAVIGARYGRGKLLAICIGLCALPILLLFGEVSALLFAAVVCLNQVGWNMGHPYILAAMSGFDPSGRLIVKATALQFIGTAVGPGFAALFVTDAGFAQVMIMAILVLALSLVAILIPIAQHNRTLRNHESSAL